LVSLVLEHIVDGSDDDDDDDDGTNKFKHDISIITHSSIKN